MDAFSGSVSLSMPSSPVLTAILPHYPSEPFEAIAYHISNRRPRQILLDYISVLLPIYVSPLFTPSKKLFKSSYFFSAKLCWSLSTFRLEAYSLCLFRINSSIFPDSPIQLYRTVSSWYNTPIYSELTHSPETILLNTLRWHNPVLPYPSKQSIPPS